MEQLDHSYWPSQEEAVRSAWVKAQVGNGRETAESRPVRGRGMTLHFHRVEPTDRNRMALAEQAAEKAAVTKAGRGDDSSR